MRRAKLAAACGATLTVLAIVPVAAAATAAASAEDTTATFVVTVGTLGITVAETASVGRSGPATAINTPLGVVTVSDERASPDGTWSAVVTATNVSARPGAGAQMTFASEIAYRPGPVTTTGSGTVTSGQAVLGNRSAMDTATPLMVLTRAGGTGNNTATWSPSISIRTPLYNQRHTRIVTVTHSVA